MRRYSKLSYVDLLKYLIVKQALFGKKICKKWIRIANYTNKRSTKMLLIYTDQDLHPFQLVDENVRIQSKFFILSFFLSFFPSFVLWFFRFFSLLVLLYVCAFLSFSRFFRLSVLLFVCSFLSFFRSDFAIYRNSKHSYTHVCSKCKIDRAINGLRKLPRCSRSLHL